jgi:hypothetical protein
MRTMDCKGFLDDWEQYNSRLLLELRSYHGLGLEGRLINIQNQQAYTLDDSTLASHCIALFTSPLLHEDTGPCKTLLRANLYDHHEMKWGNAWEKYLAFIGEPN